MKNIGEAHFPAWDIHNIEIRDVSRKCQNFSVAFYSINLKKFCQLISQEQENFRGKNFDYN